MPALAFLRGYSDLELMVAGFIAFAFVTLLGLLSNAILKGRGFGIAGNALLILAGCLGAIALHDWLVRQPYFFLLGLPDRAVLTALGAVCATFTLIAAAFMKRFSA